MPQSVIWCLALLALVAKLAAAITGEQILTAVNAKLPLDRQFTYPIGWQTREIYKLYTQFYPSGPLVKRSYRLSILSMVSGVLAFAFVFLRAS